MDANDICLPDWFAKQVSFLDQNSRYVLIGGCIATMDADARPIGSTQIPTEHEKIDTQNLRGTVSVLQPTVMIRREVVLKCDGHLTDMIAAEDLDLWFRMAEIGRLANLPDIVLKYRIHDQSISGSKQHKQREMRRLSCEAAWARRGLTDTRFDYGEWRMDGSLDSRRTFCRSYGWQAWQHGHRATWRHYALCSVALAPFSKGAWKLLIAGAMKRPPASSRASDE